MSPPKASGFRNHFNSETHTVNNAFKKIGLCSFLILPVKRRATSNLCFLPLDSVVTELSKEY